MYFWSTAVILRNALHYIFNKQVLHYLEKIFKEMTANKNLTMKVA